MGEAEVVEVVLHEMKLSAVNGQRQRASRSRDSALDAPVVPEVNNSENSADSSTAGPATGAWTRCAFTWSR
ncbi:hypothetical protein GCM10011588_00970 [Nocardia jinanensis]|uniref:Uncharacterized protein n=1 Tax=Nocardia jinanensis TaxID=382504 RepID=A0A917VKH3_9NOCA|nr:hypothetical protein GCM10011588_00970 [Nocardia jinanensis]